MAPLEGIVEALVKFLFDKNLIEKKILTYGYNLVSLPLKDLTLPQIKQANECLNFIRQRIGQGF
jgi:hypothetical protein